MISCNRILKKIGRDIIIYPFNKKNLKGIGYNLTVGSYAWSVATKNRIPLTKVGDRDAFEVSSGDTALVMTSETVWVSRNIAGTFHSKVDRVSEGFSSISTTLDPEWIGALLIAITNNTSKNIHLLKNDSFTTLVFHEIDKAPFQLGKNPAGRLDRLQKMGFELGENVHEWMDESYQQEPASLKAIFREKKQDEEVKKFLEENKKLGYCFFLEINKVSSSMDSNHNCTFNYSLPIYYRANYVN